MAGFAAIEVEYARQDPLTGAEEYWSRVASLLENGSPNAVMFVIGVGLKDVTGQPVEAFDLEKAFEENDLTIDSLALKCLDALSLGRFGLSFEDLLKQMEEREAKAEEEGKSQNPPVSPDTGSTD
ncbi:MAG: hypothetical protein JJ979_02760 [Roseibium sp.]|nr:hypothetical protein [Roseibium sp.]